MLIIVLIRVLVVNFCCFGDLLDPVVISRCLLEHSKLQIYLQRHMTVPSRAVGFVNAGPRNCAKHMNANLMKFTGQ